MILLLKNMITVGSWISPCLERSLSCRMLTSFSFKVDSRAKMNSYVCFRLCSIISMHLNCPFLLLLAHFCFLIGFEVSSDLLSVKHSCFQALMPFWKVIQLSQEKSPLELTLFPASVPNSSKPVNHFSQPPFNKESLRFHNFYQYDDQSNNNLPVELKLEDSPTLQLTQHNEN